jgi:hypothetical protein
MNASTREEVEAFRLLALRSALKLEAVGMKSSKGRSAFSIVKRMTGINARSAKELLPIYEGVLRDMGVLSPKKNPVSRKSTPRSGKWKIQTASANGWADLKASIDGGPYVPDLYDSKAEAQREMDDIVESTGSGDEYGSYRVVPASTRANDDLYNPLVRRKGESERDFMARCMSQEKKSFPKQKQRVAVCLSKSRRNPYYDRNLDS